MRSKPRALLDNVYRRIEMKFRRKKRRKAAKNLLRKMNGGCREHDNIYRTEILPYWKKYGIKPSKMWHRIYSKPGIPYDVRYIPDDLWVSKIASYFSNMDFRRALEDKCLHNVQFPNVKRPTTVVKKIAGLYYSEDLQLLNTEVAIDQIVDENEELIVKPSIDSGAGRLIRFISPQETDREEIKKIISNCGENFIVQKLIRQHPVLAQFNPTSVNTIRTISFLFDNEVHILSSALRIGGKGSKVDNFSQGGYMCQILPNGYMAELAYDNDHNSYLSLPGSEAFAVVKIPSYDKIIEIIIEEAAQKPHFKIIGWDFTVSPEGEPIMIEYNTAPLGVGSQMACGPHFGELTEAALTEVFIEKNSNTARIDRPDQFSVPVNFSMITSLLLLTPSFLKTFEKVWRAIFRSRIKDTFSM